MASVLDDVEPGGSVAVVRLRSLGDSVLTTPALRILKRARPDLRVAVMVEDRFRAVFEDQPDTDEILPPRLDALRRFRPALCVNLHGGTRSAWMTRASGARRRAGFGHNRMNWAYNLHIPRAQQNLGVERTVHTAEHLASAMFWLGAPACEIPRASLGSAPRASSASSSSAAVLHPFAATPEKTWPAEGFRTVARHLERSGMEVVIIGGAGDDFTPFRAWRTMPGAPLGEVKELLAGAALFVGNDSGPAHMAAAFGLPVVAIFGASDPAIWGPWRTQSEVVARSGGGGIGAVSAEAVLEALARLGVRA
ncbi:MAG: glycosyltransferase family 9 protein [Bryobacteraceae bacterium]